MVVMLVVFLILMALVKKFAWGPVVDTMEKRERYVAAAIDAAEQRRKDAEGASAQAEEQLKQPKKRRNTKNEEDHRLKKTLKPEGLNENKIVLQVRNKKLNVLKKQHMKKFKVKKIKHCRHCKIKSLHYLF